MSLPSPEPMSREELDALFPDGVPVLLVKLLFPAVSEELTVGDLRQIARALAAYNANQRTLLSHAPATEIETEAMDRAWRAWIETSSCRTAVGHFAFAAGYAAAKDATPPPSTHVVGLADRLRYEAEGMDMAMYGEEFGDTNHLQNWRDKPHRVVFDATKLLREAADALSAQEVRR